MEHYPDTVWQKRSLFLLGRTLIERNRTDEAAAVMLRIPTEYPVLADYALFLLAEHYAAQGRLAESVDLYHRLVESYPSSALVPRALMRLGAVLLQAGRSGEAVKAYERVLTEFPWADEAPEAGIGLGSALAALGDLSGAARALLNVTVRYPGRQDDEVAARLDDLRTQGVVVPVLTADEHYERAIRLFRAALYDKAYASLTSVLDAEPAYGQRADILLRSGIALYYLGRRPEAASVLERLRSARLPDCRCDEALNWLGRSYSRLGLREEALATYGKLVKSYPESEWADDALYLSGNVHRDAGDMRKALTYYRRLVEEYPDSSLADSALWWEGWEHYSRGEDGKAIKALQELVRRYPRSFLVNQALYWQGRAAERLDEWERAAKYYERVLRHGPFSYYGYRAEERLAGKEVPAAALSVSTDDVEELVADGQEGYRDSDAAVDDGQDQADQDALPDWSDEVIATMSSSPAYRKTLELMQLGMRQDAAAELALLQNLLPRRYGALMGLSKAYFELGDYHRSIVIILRNFERHLERPSNRFPEDLWLLAYPQGFWSSVVTHARKYGVDPFLVAAIIRQESQFHSEALSPAGARGVMQVMPATGAWIARSAGMSGFDRTKLFDADVNINLGAWYLSYLMKRFQGNLYLVSAAYNAGPDAVRSWGVGGARSDPAAFVEAIPYTETRGYVKKVLRNYDEYRRIYGVGGPPTVIPASATGQAAGATPSAAQVCSTANCP